MLVVVFSVLLCTRAVEPAVEALAVIAAPSSRTLTYERVLAAHPFYLLLKTKLALSRQACMLLFRLFLIISLLSHSFFVGIREHSFSGGNAYSQPLHSPPTIPPFVSTSFALAQSEPRAL